MIRKDRKTFKDGRVKTQIRVTEGYRPYPDSSPRQRTVKSFGYLEDQADPDAFWKEVNACNESLKKARDLRIEIPLSEKMYSENNRLLNYGYKYPEAVYRLLEIDGFLDNYQKRSGFKGMYSLADVFRYLVMDRILYPFSDRVTSSRPACYYGMNSEFRLHELGSALEQIDNAFPALQCYISDRMEEVFGFDLRASRYSIISMRIPRFQAAQDPNCRSAVAVGLFSDKNGLPVRLDLYPAEDCNTENIKINLTSIKTKYDIPYTVVIVDEGAGDIDLKMVCAQKDGYVSIRAFGAAPAGSRTAPEEGECETANAPSREWETVQEVVSGRVKKVIMRRVNTEGDTCAAQNCVHDGSFSASTNEADYGAAEILDAFLGLRETEESFGLAQCDFGSGRVYGGGSGNVKAHFMVCFTALAVIRLMQRRMGSQRLPANRIAQVLRQANCLLERGGYVRLLDVGGKIRCREIREPGDAAAVPVLQFGSDDLIACDYRRIQAVFGKFRFAYAKQEDFKRFLNSIIINI